MRRLLVLLALVAAACGSSGGDGGEPALPASGDGTVTSTARGTGEGEPTARPDGEPGPVAGADAASGEAPTTGDTPATADTAPGSRAAEPAAGGSAEIPTVYAPPPGRYVYDTSGHSSSGSGPTARRREAPPTSTDDVTVTARGEVTEVRTVSTYGDERSQETIVEVSGGEARLTRLAFRGTSAAGVATEQAVHPSPPVLVARLPLVVGDRWEIEWTDPSLGLQAIGSGAVLRREPVDTGAGGVDAVVLEIHQRVHGTFDGDLTATVWLDPTSGVQVKAVTVTDIRTATGASHDEITRVLRSGPG